MKAESTKAGSSLVLCFLTDDWQTRVTEGPRSKGETVKFRFGVTATNYGWALTEFRENAPPIMRKHACCLSNLTPLFKTEANLDPFEGIRRCQQALEAIAKKNPNLKPLPTDNRIELAMDFASQIDSAYNTNYALDDDVRERFFGSAEDDTEE